VVRKIVEECAQRKVRYLTLFAFSSENWRRPPDEVGVLMGLFLDALVREVADLHRNQVRLRFIGNRDLLGLELKQRMHDAEALTAANSGLGLMVAVAYGGRWDIARACQALACEVAAGKLAAADIAEEHVAARLELAGIPDPDLLIRTGAEQRISNFLLWNLAYTELYFTEVLWPEFSPAHLQGAFEHFARRERRFGKTSEQVGAKAGA
jgi:undecaprenyl diphosphate synthase